MGARGLGARIPGEIRGIDRAPPGVQTWHDECGAERDTDPEEPMSTPKPTPPAIGTLIAGRYRVDRVLGTGGMGVVVAAHAPPDGPPVAVKLLHAHLLEEPIHAARFQREARTMERLRTEHTPRCIETGVGEGGVPFIVMDLIEGDDLWTIVRRIGPLPVEVAASYVLQVCVALGEAHALGVVHRDLKPGNLMRSRRPDGTARITVLDFGIASPDLHESGLDGNRTEPDAFLGSYNYMSPEQIQSPRGVDPRSDIWALGGILHFLLTGAAPFAAPTAAETVAAILRESPRLQPFLERAIPAELCAVVLRCLEKSPADRFSRAIEVARALAPFCGGGGARLGTDRRALYETQRMTMSPIPRDAPCETQAPARAPSVPPTTLRMVPAQPVPTAEIEAEALALEPTDEVSVSSEAEPAPETHRTTSPTPTEVPAAPRERQSAPCRAGGVRGGGGARTFLSVSFLALMVGGSSGALWKGVSRPETETVTYLSGQRLPALVASAVARAAPQPEPPGAAQTPLPMPAGASDATPHGEATGPGRARPAPPRPPVSAPAVEAEAEAPSDEVGQRPELRDPYAEERVVPPSRAVEDATAPSGVRGKQGPSGD